MAGKTGFRAVKYSDNYKYVQSCTHTRQPGKLFWVTNLPGVTRKGYDTEREAAIAVDKYFIGRGKKPVNILKAA